jgi:hypothetical protein
MSPILATTCADYIPMARDYALCYLHGYPLGLIDSKKQLVARTRRSSFIHSRAGALPYTWRFA